MRAIILAAGRGERMRPLTDHTPKPLLAVQGKPLIEWHVEALARDGVREIVINTAWLEDVLIAALGDGARFGVSIRYSTEGRDHGHALETAGGIATALPLLADGSDAPFWIVSGDIFAPGFRFDADTAQRSLNVDVQAHLWLVPNPPFHSKGDFGFDADGSHLLHGPGPDGQTWTYANLALCRPSLVSHIAPGTRSALGPLLFERSREGRITGEVFEGTWENVGTPEQLQRLNREL